MMPQKPSQSPFTLQLMSPRSQLQKMCRVNTATPTPGPSAGSSCQRWGLRTPRLAALLLLLLPGEQEHVCHLQEQVEKDSELKRGSCRQPGAHAEGGAGRAEGRGSLTEQPAAPSRVWRQQWDPKETPDGFEDEKQSLVPAKPLSSPSFSLFLRAVGRLRSQNYQEAEAPQLPLPGAESTIHHRDRQTEDTCSSPNSAKRRLMGGRRTAKPQLPYPT
ncbi:uncharacterized protein LOC131410567 isoform X8 [Diceros bicornis minor]|uniref:uncharacterized protein LOC131410567 isoform X8 n=1 Tax=Diceros bicornis minor TaxID=77932 RepID=UPI0026F02F87|nr:uncharacterized protein LOC131410567 isoform X8 [Diceros bicornis minor]